MIEPIISRSEASSALSANPVIAVLRADRAEQYAPVIEALVAGGIGCIELTLSTSGVIEALPGLASEFGTDVEIGVGTITTTAQAGAVLDAGARFLVTPVLNVDVVHAAAAQNIPVYPGGLTPTELYSGWQAGATAVKVFPASVVGPGYIGQLRGPFPDLEVVPSGGVAIDDVQAWIAAGAMAVSLGGPLIGDAFRGGDLTALARRASRVSDLAADAVRQRDGR